MPKIARLSIQNFRSIRSLDLRLNDFNAFIGRNNVGKSNIMEAIKLMLDEKWPTYHISEDDICKYGNNQECSIKLHFTEPIPHPSYQNMDIYGLSLSFNKGTGPEFICLSESGTPLLTNWEKYVFPSKELRELVPVVYIGIQRDLSYLLSPKYNDSILDKIFEICKKEFETDPKKKDRFKTTIKEVDDIVKTDKVKEFQDAFSTEVKRLLGIEEIEINLKEPDILEFYKSMPLFVKESKEYESASAFDMGTGIQSSLAIALIKAFNSISHSSIILCMEEPEIYLHPHARKHFYNTLLEFSNAGTQIIYTTHSSEFVGIDSPQTINIVKKSAEQGTYVEQGLKLHWDEDDKIKLYTRFNSDRNEIFFAEKVVLVEGPTEQKSLPIAFELNGIDINKSNISIIDSGGVDGIKFLVKILNAFKIPFVVIADTDSNKKSEEFIAKRNAQLRQICSDEKIFFLDPDFESVFEITSNDKSKPANAIEKLAKLKSKNELPEKINEAIRKLAEIH